MLNQPASQEDYEELAEALDVGTANELLSQGWHLLAVVSGGPVTYVFGKPRIVDLQEVMKSTAALLEESSRLAAPVEEDMFQGSSSLAERYR